MAKHERFHYRTLDEVRADVAALGLPLKASDSIDALLQPVKVAHLTAPNAMAVHPMEGCDGTAEGAPDELTFRRYKRFAAGGAGLLWFEATAVVHEGRANPRQIYLNENTYDGFARLLEESLQAARESMGPNHRPITVVQLTHSGRYSKPDGKAAPIIAHHSAVLDKQHKLPPDYPLISDDELERLIDKFVAAAKLAKRAGFDCIDIKSCHRYLAAELHASFTRHESRFGGSFENRTRFVRTIAQRVLAEVPGILVGLRMNAYDAIPYPYGWGVDMNDHMKPDLTEPKQLVEELRKIGISIANITVANPYFNPHVNRPFDYPTVNGYIPEEHPLEGVARIVEIGAQMQKANQGFPIVSTGYSWLREFGPYFAAATLESGGATFVGLGRMSFAMPHFPKALMVKGKLDPLEVCIACSSCTQIMRDGGRTGCVIRDGAVYGPIYLEGRMRDHQHVRAIAQACRNCTAPTCAIGCPAKVDVPGFIRAIAEGHDREAYCILRKTNPLPEICSYVCPSKVQCEGGCIQQHLTGSAIPVRLLQRYASEKARAEGWATIEVPENPSGKKVAVIGAGPAGLGAAIGLLEKGHEVAIFDAGRGVAGTAGEIIPKERLTKALASAEVTTLLGNVPSSRLKWHLGQGLSATHTVNDLRKAGFDAVFIAVGLSEGTLLPGAKRPKTGVVDALSFLKEHKDTHSGGVPAAVAVLGGGNTALDAAVTAKRLGARDVYIVYRRSFAEMPGWPEERDAALARGIHFLILTQPVDYVADAKGRLTGVKIARTRLGEPDASGRRKPETIAGSESVLEVGLAVEALGQRAPEGLESALAGVQMARGLIKTEPGSAATSVADVFAGGDIVNGGTTAAQAVYEGYRAAAEIDAYLAEAARK